MLIFFNKVNLCRYFIVAIMIISGLIPVISYASDDIPDGVWICTYWSGGKDCSEEKITVYHKTKDIIEIEGSYWWAYVARKKGSKKLNGFWQPEKVKEERYNQANPAEAYIENGKLKVRWQHEIKGKVFKGNYSLYEFVK